LEAAMRQNSHGRHTIADAADSWPEKIMKLRLTITLVLFLLVMIFALQNTATVEIRLLLWQVALPRSLLIFMMLLIGIIIGWFSRSAYRIARSGG
jgi:uncharacterized integral membrane protein